MSYSTKGILYDKDDNPVPQYFNAGDDTYEVVQGEDGKMFVRASEIEDTLAALIGEVQATPTANTLLARLKSLEDKIDAITDGTSPAVTQLSGSNVAEMQDQSNATADVLTFSENITSIEIYHSETTPQSFTVNGLTLIVAAGGWRSPIAGTPGATVGIPTGVNCIVARLV